MILKTIRLRLAQADNASQKSINFISENKPNIMLQKIAHITLLVKDYDEAIKFYTEKLGFQLQQDQKLSEEKRWVLVSPKGPGTCSILLAKATNEKQMSSVGNQTGGRVFLFLYTDDFWKDYNEMVANNVNFITLPKKEDHGTVAIFEDLYGNLWDFIQPN